MTPTTPVAPEITHQGHQTTPPSVPAASSRTNDVDHALQAHEAIQEANLKGWWTGFAEGYTAACIDQADGLQPGPSEGVKERNRLWAEYNSAPSEGRAA